MKIFFSRFVVMFVITFNAPGIHANEIELAPQRGCDNIHRRFNLCASIVQPFDYAGVWKDEANTKEMLLLSQSAQTNNLTSPYVIWLSFDGFTPRWHSFGNTSVETSNQSYLFAKFRHTGKHFNRNSRTYTWGDNWGIPIYPYLVSSVSVRFQQQSLRLTEISDRSAYFQLNAKQQSLNNFVLAVDEDLSRGIALWLDGTALSGVVFDYDDMGKPTWYKLSSCVGEGRLTCQIIIPTPDGKLEPRSESATIEMDSSDSWRVELPFRDYIGDPFWIQQRLRVVTQTVSTTRLMRRVQ